MARLMLFYRGMKDTMISLGFTAIYTPFIMAYIVGWAQTKSTIITLLEWAKARVTVALEDNPTDW